MKFSSLTVTLAFLTTYQWSIQDVSAAKCTITNYNADGIRRALSECSQITIDGIEVPAGETLTLTLRPGTKVIFSGTIKWAYKEWKGPLLSITGVNVEITGAPGHVLDGRGYFWWDGAGDRGGRTKPNLIKAKLTNSQIHDIKIRNSPLHVFSFTDCDDMVVKDITIDNSAGDSRGALNTKAFDVRKSSNIRISGCTVWNQNDCLALHSGSNIRFFNHYCSGGGITIGSVGELSSNSVSNVVIRNSTITNSDNGVRIITVSGASGSVSDITYEDIALSSIHKYGIVIEGDYQNGSPTGNPIRGVQITNLRVRNIHGTVDSSGVNIYVLVAGASNWNFSNINVTGGTKTKRCTGIPSGAGISC